MCSSEKLLQSRINKENTFCLFLLGWIIYFVKVTFFSRFSLRKCDSTNRKAKSKHFWSCWYKELKTKWWRRAHNKKISSGKRIGRERYPRTNDLCKYCDKIAFVAKKKLLKKSQSCSKVWIKFKELDVALDVLLSVYRTNNKHWVDFNFLTMSSQKIELVLFSNDIAE